MTISLRRASFVLFCCTVLAGCHVGDAYQRPAIAMPQTWQNQRQENSWPDTAWWEAFHSPVLSALIDQAKDNNDDLKAAVARIRQADAQLKIAGAALLPSIDLGESSQRSQTAARRNTSKVTTANSNTLSLSATNYELDFWGKNQAAVESGSASAEAARFDMEVIKLDTLSGVANTYFDYLAARHRLDIAHKNLAVAEHLLNSYRLRQREGLSSSLDVSQQENVVAVQKATLPPLELLAEQNRNALAILVGQMPQSLNLDSRAAEDFEAILTPAVVAGIPSELLLRRPDVAKSEAYLQARNADVSAARAALFPSISLTVDGGFSSAVLSNLISPQSRFFSLGSSITQPIFSGGALSGEVEYQKSRYEEQFADYHKAVISAFSDVENALAAAAQYRQQELDQMAVVETAQRSYDLSQQQFDAGIVDISSVLNAQRSLFSAEDTLAQVRLSRLKAAVGLYKNLGGGWRL